MKFKDLINAVGPRKDWISFWCNWDVKENGSVVISPSVDVTLDTEVEVGYQWFHHCNPNLNRDEVWESIEQHDYNTFYKWYETFMTDHWVYLPSTANIYVGDECIGEISVAWHPSVFSLVSFQDCECG